MNQALKDMTLGVSSAAFQIEGAWNEDGKGESIWDRWLHTPGHGKATGDMACDHYHRMEEDVSILKELGVDAYRFSISWPRVLPDGCGRINEAGLDFYRRLVKRLKDAGIKPVVTLYHWDLPQKLQDKGGWANRDTARCFQEFAELMFRELGNDVSSWITFNEPYVATFVGHWAGKFAPGHQDLSEALAAAHHMLLAHGRTVQSFRKMHLPGDIGISLDWFPSAPASDDPADILAAGRDRDSHLGWFGDPIFLGHYPEALWQRYEEKGLVLPEIREGDMTLIHQPVDFLGINYYRPSIVKNSPGSDWPYDKAYVPHDGEKAGSMYYHHLPEKLYDYLQYLHRTYRPKQIMITENGYSAQEATNRNGQVLDEDRIDYLYLHLQQCIRAKEDGVPVTGYFVWSFLDDLEWTGGYTTRMGLIRVDYATQKRIWKQSAYWYQRVLKERELGD